MALIGGNALGGTATGWGFEGITDIFQGFLDGEMGYRWGLFKNDLVTPLFPDGLVYDLDYSSASQVAQAPLEDGTFLTYNKVDSPETWRIGLSFNTSKEDQADVITTLKTMRRNADICVVSMPSFFSDKTTVSTVQFKRTARNGTDLLLVVVTLQEVRAYAQTTMKQTKTGITADPPNTGNPQEPPPLTEKDKEYIKAAKDWPGFRT